MLRLIILFSYLLVSFVFLFENTVRGQNHIEELAIKEVCQLYIDGFIDGNSKQIETAVSPQLYKFGLRKSKTGDEYTHTGVLNAVSAAQLARQIGNSGGRRDAKAPEKIEILDIQGPIASVKITAIWGYDYALLAKQNGKWQIEQILWVGPLEK